MRQWSSLNKTLTWIVYFNVAALSTWFCIKANLDFTEPQLLFMDERITYDWVHKQLTQDLGGLVGWFENFWNQILDAGDNRYGRILWNYSLLISWLPFQIWGEQGQILATRFGHSAVLLASYFILCTSILKSWYTRGLGLALLLWLPGTVYHCTMPKPEPLLLLGMSSFVMLHIRKEHQLGKHWFWLGFAYGVKISALPFVLITIFWTWLNIKFRQSAPPTKKVLKETGLYTLYGLLLAAPVFLKGIPQPGIFVDYINQTYLNTLQSDDYTTVHAGTWLDFISRVYLTTPFWLLIGLLISISALVFLAIRTHLAKNIVSEKSLYMLTLGLALTMAIILNVQRLWGYYLHVGFVFLIIGALSLLETEWNHKSTNSEEHPNESIRLLVGKTVAGVIGSLLIMVLYFVSNPTAHAWELAATRSQSKQTKDLVEAMRYVKAQSADVAKQYRRDIKVALSAWLPICNDTMVNGHHIKYEVHWGDAIYKPEFTLIYAYPFPLQLQPIRHTLPQKIKADMLLYQKSVKKHIQPDCEESPCFKITSTPVDSLYVYEQTENRKP